MVPTYSGVETCIDDVDPDLLEDELRKTKGDDDVHPPMEMTLHAKEPSNDSISELDAISKNMEQNLQDANDGDDFPLPDLDELPPPPDELLVASPPEREKPQRVINRKKRDQHSMYNASRNSSCVSTDSNVSTSTMDSGIGVRAYSISDSSPRNSPTRVTSEFDEDYSHCYDEGFKGSREELLDEDCQAYSPGSNEELEQKDYKNEEIQGESPANFGTPSNGSRSDSADTSPRIEELDQEKVNNGLMLFSSSSYPNESLLATLHLAPHILISAWIINFYRHLASFRLVVSSVFHRCTSPRHTSCSPCFFSSSLNHYEESELWLVLLSKDVISNSF